jgi:hypothetical protein
MTAEVISLCEVRDLEAARNLIFAIELLDNSLAGFNSSPYDLSNIGREFLKLRLVSPQTLADYVGHTLFEVTAWLSGEEVPFEPTRTAIILGINTHIKEQYQI